MRMHHMSEWPPGIMDYMRPDPQNWRVGGQLKLDLQNSMIYPSGISHKITFSLQEAAAFMKLMNEHGPQEMANLMNGHLLYVIFALYSVPASGSRRQLLYTNSTFLRNSCNMRRWWTNGDSVRTKDMSGCTMMWKLCIASKLVRMTNDKDNHLHCIELLIFPSMLYRSKIE